MKLGNFSGRLSHRAREEKAGSQEIDRIPDAVLVYESP